MWVMSGADETAAIAARQVFCGDTVVCATWRKRGPAPEPRWIEQNERLTKDDAGLLAAHPGFHGGGGRMPHAAQAVPTGTVARYRYQ
jgi:hypothetical protein